jgi:hypothetical protein
MKPAAFVVLLVCMLLCAGFTARAFPQQEDPLLTGNVPVSLTPGDLYLRELTLPPGLFLWRTLKEVEGLNTAQLRTLVHRLWIVRRRYFSPAAKEILVDAWADRDLAGAVADMLTISRWEDDDPWIGSYDIDIEMETALLWCRLAGQNWKQALTLLEKVNHAESGRQFWEGLSSFLTLPPDHLPAFATALASRPQEVTELIKRVVWSSAKEHGSAATERAAGKIKNRSLRDLALTALDKMQDPADDPPSSPQAAPALENATLRKLLALDNGTETRFRFPFPLLRAVLKLTSAEALDLAKQLPRHPQPPGYWLAWTLFMRAADGDPAAAQSVAAGLSTGGLNASRPMATLFALRADMDVDRALKEMQDIPSIEDQRDALSGYLTGKSARDIIVKQLGSPLTAFAKQIELPADRWRTALCCAAASGAGEAALKAAASIKENPNAEWPGLRAGVIQAWALSDLPSFCKFAETIADGDHSNIILDGFGNVLPFLPEAALLNPEHPLPPKLVARAPEMHWQFLAFEARAEAFRNLGQHAKEPEYADAIRRFTQAAARYEPERAMALHRQSVVSGEPGPVEQIVYFHADEPKVLAATLSTDEQWERAGTEMARHFPDKALALLKKAPAAASRGAAMQFLGSDPLKAESLSRFLTEEQQDSLKKALSRLPNRKSSGESKKPPLVEGIR